LGLIGLLSGTSGAFSFGIAMFSIGKAATGSLGEATIVSAGEPGSGTFSGSRERSQADCFGDCIEL
jgi:hypothetical protein